MELEGGKSYNKHKLKVYAYIKAKRLIRKAEKTFSNKNNAAMAMGMRRGGDEDDEDEMERIKEEQEERKERNRVWRMERERRRRHERGEYSEEEEVVKAAPRRSKSSNLEQVRSLLTCTACRAVLNGKIWQCQVGHPACKDCVDLFWLEEDDVSLSGSSKGSSSRKTSCSSTSSRFSAISDDSVKELIERMSERELMDLVDRYSDTASTVTFSGPTLTERQIEEIDWFLGTLDIRNDAIKPYTDYNNEAEMARAALEDARVVTPQESSDDDTIEDEDDAWKIIPKDEVAIRHQQNAKAKLKALNHVDEDSGNDTLSESTQLDFSAPPRVIKSIDFFKDTIEIKKDVIAPYTDYNAGDQAGPKTVRISDNVQVFESDDDDEDNLDSASMLGRKRFKTCRSCDAPIVGRSLFLEGVCKVVHKK